VRNRPARPARTEVIHRDELHASVLVRSGDTVGGRPLHDVIVRRAKAAGLSGATAIRGMQGFGASGKLPPLRLGGLTGSEPVLIEITDDAAVVRAFLPVLDRLVGSGLLVLKEVTVTRRATAAEDVAATVASP
jgi:uncharacterized protein